MRDVFHHLYVCTIQKFKVIRLYRNSIYTKNIRNISAQTGSTLPAFDLDLDRDIVLAWSASRGSDGRHSSLKQASVSHSQQVKHGWL